MKEVNWASESKLLEESVNKLFKITAKTSTFFLSGKSEEEINNLLKIREEYLDFNGLWVKYDDCKYGDVVNIKEMEEPYFNNLISHSKEFLNKNQ